MTRRLLIEHCRKYPALQVRDLLKFLHQSSFGCEHLISSPDKVTEYIRQEFAECGDFAEEGIEALDGPYSRVHLGYMKQGISAETLGKLFFLSAKKELNGAALLKQKLETAKSLTGDGLLPFSAEELACAVEEWERQGYPAVRHTEIFRAAYRPAYRVIANEFIAFLPLLAKIDAVLKESAVQLTVGDIPEREKLCALLGRLYHCTDTSSAEAGTVILIGASDGDPAALSADAFLPVSDK